MISGIGNDLVALPRLSAMLERHPKRLPERLLCATEVKEFECLREKAPTKRLCEFLAARVAAKEALGKALGIGLRAPLSWRQVSVKKDKAGRPFFVFSPKLQNYLEQEKISACHLTLSHDDGYAMATVVAEKN